MAVPLAAALAGAACLGGVPVAVGRANHDGGAAVVVDAATPDVSSFSDAIARDASGMSLRILFVGDSYTSVNDLPALVHDALASAPDVGSVDVESVTIGGATFGQLWDEGTAPAEIRTGHFTHVVLQGQSTEYGRDPDSFTIYSQKFAAAVHDAGAVVDFFETWPRRAGDPLYSDPEWGHRCPSAMLSAADTFYRYEAWTSHSELAPVGDAWAAVIATHPEIDLYAADGSHPSIAGSWLAASVLVCTIAHRSAKGLRAPSAISAADAAILAEAADQLCESWKAFDGGIDVPSADCSDASDAEPD